MLRNFLAQLEGGVFDERTERQIVSGEGSISAGFGAGPLQAEGRRGKGQSLETEAVVRQVAASEFQRLYDALKNDDLVLLDAIDDASVVGEIQRKQILEVDARVCVSGTHKFFDLMSQITAMAPLAKQFGQDLDLDEDMVSGVEMMKSLGESDGKLAVIATIPGSAGTQVVLELDRSLLLTTTWDVDATVLLTVQRVLPQGQRYLAGDPFGGFMKLVPEEQRIELADSLKSDDTAQLIGDVEVVGPAIVGTPIAIYR